MLRSFVMFTSVLAALSACTTNDNRTYINGIYYPAKVRSDKSDRQVFAVSVSRIEQGLDGAREAGRHAANEYCIKRFGSSEIAWVKSPDDEANKLDVSGGQLMLSGRCTTW